MADAAAAVASPRGEAGDNLWTALGRAHAELRGAVRRGRGTVDDSQEEAGERAARRAARATARQASAGDGGRAQAEGAGEGDNGGASSAGSEASDDDDDDDDVVASISTAEIEEAASAGATGARLAVATAWRQAAKLTARPAAGDGGRRQSKLTGLLSQSSIQSLRAADAEAYQEELAAAEKALREELARRKAKLRVAEAARARVEGRLAHELAFRERLHTSLTEIAKAHGHALTSDGGGGVVGGVVVGGGVVGGGVVGAARRRRADSATTWVEIMFQKCQHAEKESERLHAELTSVLAETERHRDVRRAYGALSALSGGRGVTLPPADADVRAGVSSPVWEGTDEGEAPPPPPASPPPRRQTQRATRWPRRRQRRMPEAEADAPRDGFRRHSLTCTVSSAGQRRRRGARRRRQRQRRRRSRSGRTHGPLRSQRRREPHPAKLGGRWRQRARAAGAGVARARRAPRAR